MVTIVTVSRDSNLISSGALLEPDLISAVRQLPLMVTLLTVSIDLNLISSGALLEPDLISAGGVNSL